MTAPIQSTAPGRDLRPASGGDICSQKKLQAAPLISSGRKYPGGERAPAREGGSAPSLTSERALA